MPLAPGLFRAHVPRRSGVPRPLAQVLLPQRQAEIDDEGLPVGSIRMLPGLTSRWTSPCLCAWCSASATVATSSAACLQVNRDRAEPGGEVLAVDELRDDEAGILVGPPDVVDRDDVGMVQAGDVAGLREVELGVLWPLDQPGVGHLDGHVAMQLLVEGQVDQAEPPLPQQPLHPITADPLRAALTAAAGAIPGAGTVSSPRGSSRFSVVWLSQGSNIKSLGLKPESPSATRHGKHHVVIIAMMAGDGRESLSASHNVAGRSPVGRPPPPRLRTSAPHTNGACPIAARTTQGAATAD